MSDPTEYQQKVAKVIACRLRIEHPMTMDLPKTWGIIAAVLAAEGVGDPDDVTEKWSDAYATAENRITNLEQQLAALRTGDSE